MGIAFCRISLPMDFLATGLCLLPCAVIAYAVVAKDKTLGALVQLNGLGWRRECAESLSRQNKLNSQSDEMSTTKGKLWFTLGGLNLAMTPYVLGHAPTFFYLLYTPKLLIMITSRWWDFLSQKKHYLLLDFCYWANALVLYYIWIVPGDERWFQVIFALSNGPLAWSMLAFNHSMVFHSYPHITSVFIHASPMLLTWGLRWHSQPGVAPDFAICDPADAVIRNGLVETCGTQFTTYVWNALKDFYLPWIVLYYCGVFVLLGDYLKTRGYETLYDRVTKSGPLKPILAKTQGMHDLIGKFVYVLCHLLFGAITICITFLWWNNIVAHFAFILTICTSTLWNGAGHYSAIFANNRPTAATTKEAVKKA